MATVSVSIAKESTSQEILTAIKKIPTTGGSGTTSGSLDGINVYVCDFGVDEVICRNGAVDLNARVIRG